MKPDYDWYLHHDPCKICVFCSNQYVESDCYPCSICHNFSEFIPEGGEGPVETNFLNDIMDYIQVIELMDEITDKIHILDEKVPGIASQAESLLNYFNAVKASSAEAWMLGPDDLGGPCYDGGVLVTCDECTKDVCPYRGK
jgi:hypothetical protein